MALPGSMELKIAAEFRKRIEEFLGEGLRDVRIFGSRTRGEGHSESDLDIFVLLDRYDRERRSRIIDIACEINLEYDFIAPLSPLVMDEQEFSLYRSRERRLVLDIVNEGVPV
jgi:predicted nucleotidyltransferase